MLKHSRRRAPRRSPLKSPTRSTSQTIHHALDVAAPASSPPSRARYCSTSAASIRSRPCRSSSARWSPMVGWPPAWCRHQRSNGCIARQTCRAGTAPMATRGCGGRPIKPARCRTTTSVTARRCVSATPRGRCGSTRCSTTPRASSSHSRPTTASARTTCSASSWACSAATAPDA